MLQWEAVGYHHKCWFGYSLSNQNSFYAVQLMLCYFHLDSSLTMNYKYVYSNLRGISQLNCSKTIPFYLNLPPSPLPTLPPTPPNRPILSHTSLSNRPSANILYSEISVKSGDGTWGNISKSRTAGSQPHKGSYYSSASGFWDLLCTCASDSLHGKC